MPKLDRRIQPRFTPEQVKALLALCDNSPRGLWHRAIILGLLDRGLRASEFVSLKVDDVDMRTGLVTVVGKRNKQRRVRFGVKTRKGILKYLAGRKQGSEALWMARRGPLTLRGLESICKRLGEKAGVKCHPHRLTCVQKPYDNLEGPTIWHVRVIRPFMDGQQTAGPHALPSTRVRSASTTQYQSVSCIS